MDSNRALRTAIVLALIGLVFVLIFLIRGFTAATVGIGVFIGAPLLIVAMILYLVVVIRDVRRHGLL